MPSAVMIHPDCPGPFGPLAAALAQTDDIEPIFLSLDTGPGGKKEEVAGVRHFYLPLRSDRDLKSGSSKNDPGVLAARFLQDLTAHSGTPAILISCSGTPLTRYLKDALPDSSYLAFFPSHYSFGHLMPGGEKPDLAFRIALRDKALAHLPDLAACEHGICRTHFYKQTFPESYQNKLQVIQEGIDTSFFVPGTAQGDAAFPFEPVQTGSLIVCALQLRFPCHGFERFLSALSRVLAKREDAHVVFLPENSRVRKVPQAEERAALARLVEVFDIPAGRAHVMDQLSKTDYLALLQTSALYVHANGHGSFRMCLEAMSCECLVMAPDTALFKEVIKDGTNGILVKGTAAGDIAKKMNACLDYPSFMAAVKNKARTTIKEGFFLEKSIAEQLTLIRKMIRNRTDRFG